MRAHYFSPSISQIQHLKLWFGIQKLEMKKVHYSFFYFYRHLCTSFYLVAHFTLNFFCPTESDEGEQGSSDVVSPRQVTPAPPLTNITNLQMSQNLEDSHFSTFNAVTNSTNLRNPSMSPRQPINGDHTLAPPLRQSRQDVDLRSDSQDKILSTAEPQRIQPQIIKRNIPSSSSIQPPSNPYTSTKAKTPSFGRSKLSSTNGSRSLKHHDSKQISNPYTTQSTPFSKHTQALTKRDGVVPIGRNSVLENHVIKTPSVIGRNKYSATTPVPIDLTSPNSTSASVSSLSTTSQCKYVSKKAPISPQKLNSSRNSHLKSNFTPEEKDLVHHSLESLNIMSPTALSEPVSFNELKSILQKVFSDPSVYDHYKRRTFIVPSKMSCSKRQKDKTNGFTLEKNRHHKKKNLNSEKVKVIRQMVSASFVHLDLTSKLTTLI